MESFGGFCPIEFRCFTKDEMVDALCEYPEGSKMVLLMDEFLVKLNNLECLVERMGKRYDFTWISKVNGNPTQKDVKDTLEKIGRGKPSKLVAIGGGSTMDLTKACSALFYNFEKGDLSIEEITDLIKTKKYRENPETIDIISIATTSGTGSEITKWATIWDVNKTAKFSVDDVKLYASETYVVPELTYKAPKTLVLSTGLDAFCQALESFWSKPSTPISRAVSIMAMMTMKESLKDALSDDPAVSKKGRDGMALGSALAGIAFSNTRTTACHSMSYPMTMQFGTAHGFACAVTLDEVRKINRKIRPEIDEAMIKVFGDVDGLKPWMDDVAAPVQPLRLSAFGIPKEAIPKLASAAFTAGRMDNNPADITEEMVVEILNNVY